MEEKSQEKNSPLKSSSQNPDSYLFESLQWSLFTPLLFAKFFSEASKRILQRICLQVSEVWRKRKKDKILMLKEKRGMEAEKLCLTDGMVQYISWALLLATNKEKSLWKIWKATIAFFINHIHFSYLPVVVSIVCLGMQILQGRKLHNQDIAERSSSRACSS